MAWSGYGTIAFTLNLEFQCFVKVSDGRIQRKGKLRVPCDPSLSQRCPFPVWGSPEERKFKSDPALRRQGVNW